MRTYNQEKSALEKGIQQNGGNPIIVGIVGIGSTFENRHRNGRVCQPNRENDRRCGRDPMFIPVLRIRCTDAPKPANCKPNRAECFWQGCHHSAVISY